MGCRTSSSILVASLLAISLLTHRLPVSCARRVVVLKVDDGLNNNRGDMSLAQTETASGSADDLDEKKGFQGRKLGARNMADAEAEPLGVKGDDQREISADDGRPTPQGSQMAQQGLAGPAAARRPQQPASSAAAAESRPHPRTRTVKMRTAGKRADPATEMYDMLRRDYAWKASRRRPIHNAEPLQGGEP